MDSSRSNDKYRPKPEPTERDKRLNDFKKRLTKFDEKSYGELTDQEAAGKFVLETLKDNQKRKKELKELNQSKEYTEKVRDEMKEKLHSDLLELLKQKKIHGNKEIFKSPREVLGEQEKRYDKLKKELQVEQQNLYITEKHETRMKQGLIGKIEANQNLLDRHKLSLNYEKHQFDIVSSKIDIAMKSIAGTNNYIESAKDLTSKKSQEATSGSLQKKIRHAEIAIDIDIDSNDQAYDVAKAHFAQLEKADSQIEEVNNIIKEYENNLSERLRDAKNTVDVHLEQRSKFIENLKLNGKVTFDVPELSYEKVQSDPNNSLDYEKLYKEKAGEELSELKSLTKDFQAKEKQINEKKNLISSQNHTIEELNKSITTYEKLIKNGKEELQGQYQEQIQKRDKLVEHMKKEEQASLNLSLELKNMKKENVLKVKYLIKTGNEGLELLGKFKAVKDYKFVDSGEKKISELKNQREKHVKNINDYANSLLQKAIETQQNEISVQQQKIDRLKPQLQARQTEISKLEKTKLQIQSELQSAQEVLENPGSWQDSQGTSRETDLWQYQKQFIDAINRHEQKKEDFNAKKTNFDQLGERLTELREYANADFSFLKAKLLFSLVSSYDKKFREDVNKRLENVADKKMEEREELQKQLEELAKKIQELNTWKPYSSNNNSEK